MFRLSTSKLPSDQFGNPPWKLNYHFWTIFLWTSKTNVISNHPPPAYTPPLWTPSIRGHKVGRLLPSGDASKRKSDELICTWPLTLTIVQGQVVLSRHVSRYPVVRRQHAQMSSLRCLGDVTNKVASDRHRNNNHPKKTTVNAWGQTKSRLEFRFGLPENNIRSRLPVWTSGDMTTPLLCH